ncbi:hypothetical protein CsatB_027825 [Cannabis sativa]|uniref:Uncharacterized protein n=1 Tax=Cannabis sativa TaxID=3483 RepID=A0A803QVD8_CANSA
MGVLGRRGRLFGQYRMGHDRGVGTLAWCWHLATHATLVTSDKVSVGVGICLTMVGTYGQCEYLG